MQEWKPLLKIMMQTNEQLQLINLPLDVCIIYVYRSNYDLKVEIFIDEIVKHFHYISLLSIKIL